MGDEYLDIDDQTDRQNMLVSESIDQPTPDSPICSTGEIREAGSKKEDVYVRINTDEGQSANDSFFRAHRTKIGLMILVIVLIGIAIGVGVGVTSGKQAGNKKKNEKGRVCL